MSELTLSDLDELVLTVRDRTSQTYIHEAIVAYRGRAYRAAVVSTWVAVAFDIISKIRELANQGEKAAVAFIADMDGAITAKDVKKLQQIENDLLDKATGDFEFINRREIDDLNRLKVDRNECAHPAFTTEGTLFTPSPELVRMHIVHAIDHLLRHPPVQGKAALDRLKMDILQPSFPTEQSQVDRFLADKYIKHCKASLVETLITVLLKVLIRGTDAALKLYPFHLVHCIRAIGNVKPHVYESRMPVELPKACDGTDDTQLAATVVLLHSDPRVWNWLDAPSQMRLKRIIASSGGSSFDVSGLPRMWPLFVLAADVPSLKEEVIAAFRSLVPSAQSTVIAFYPRTTWTDDVARIYGAAGDFRGAESLGNTVLLPMAPFLTALQIAAVLNAARDNGQIWYAAGTADVLEKLFDITAVARPDAIPAWNAFVDQMIARSSTDPDGHYAYPGLRRRLEALGSRTPLPPPPPPTFAGLPTGGTP